MRLWVAHLELVTIITSPADHYRDGSPASRSRLRHACSMRASDLFRNGPGPSHLCVNVVVKPFDGRRASRIEYALANREATRWYGAAQARILRTGPPGACLLG